MSLLDNDKLNRHPYLVRMPRDDKEWTRFIQALNDASIDVSGSPGLDESAQDAVGGILVDTASIDFSYSDATPSISAQVLPNGVDHNQLANLPVGDPHTQYFLKTGSLVTANFPALVVPDAALSANVPLKNADNILTGNNQIKNGYPYVELYEDDVAADTGKWRVQSFGSTFFLTTMNDAGTAFTSFLSAIRSGGVGISVLQLQGEAIIFSMGANGMLFSGNDPLWYFGNGLAAANEKNWEMISLSGDKTLRLRAVNDAFTTFGNVLVATRSAAAITDITLGNATDNPTFTFAGTGRTTFGGVVKKKGFTVAGLPAGSIGDEAYVTDAAAPVFGAAVVGGGAVMVPVYYTGAAWFVG